MSKARDNFKRRVLAGIRVADHYSCDLDCGHVVVVQGTKRPSAWQHCRFCADDAARKAAKEIIHFAARLEKKGTP